MIKFKSVAVSDRGSDVAPAELCGVVFTCTVRGAHSLTQQTYHGVVSGDFVEICLMINKVSAVRKPFLEISKAEDILSFRI